MAQRPRFLFVTGKLAEPSLRRLLERLSVTAGFDYQIAVLPISVVALASIPWIARHLAIPESVLDRVILPGLCQGELSLLAEQMPCPVDRGPKDLRDLPRYFGSEQVRSAEYGSYDIEILSEINHAPQQTLDAILEEARRLTQNGADLIDLGCDPGSTWNGIREVVRCLREEGIRTSVDSFNPVEVEQAVEAGAELVLSVNSSNREQACAWGAEVVAIPDEPATLAGLDETIELLSRRQVRFRVDAILEPIGYGFAASLGRYLEVRRRYPELEMMMGVGNLTELTDVDSSGINVLLLGFCQEQGIRSVLTTEVINWCRSCTKEIDLARRLVYHSWHEKVLPKHLEPNLVLLRDPVLHEHGQEELEELAANIKDRNYRIFAEGGFLHLMNSYGYRRGREPFALFEGLEEEISPSHAFYLGYEMAKAVTALTLGKQYNQDQPLDWGFLTLPEEGIPDKKSKDSSVGNEDTE